MHPHSCSCARALPKWPLISVKAWLPQGDPDRPMATAKALMISHQAPVLATPCETGTEAAHGLLEAAAGTWSSLEHSLLYCEYFFLSKTTLSSQFILHECYPILYSSSFWRSVLKVMKLAGQSPPAPHISPSYCSAKAGNRLPKMVASSVSQLLTPKSQRLLRPSPQPSSAWFQRRSNGPRTNLAMPDCLAGMGRDGQQSAQAAKVSSF